MGEPILQTNIERDKTYLYYVGTNEDGKLVLCKAKLQVGRKKKKQEEKSKNE